MFAAHLTSAPQNSKQFIEDLFSTYLYTGNGSTQTITNGIDLAGKGGVVWLKNRGAAGHGFIQDTARGVSKYLLTSSTNAEATNNAGERLTSYNNNGFSLGSDPGSAVNAATNTYVSWTFRKAAKFFDVVTWTGDGALGRQISHSLGGTPGFIIVKRTDTTSDWTVWHRSVTGNAFLQTTDAWQAGYTRITTADATTLTVSDSSMVNASGGTYVAYLFAHDTSADGLIQCGSYTGNGSASGPTVTLGWEPQYVLVKNVSNGAAGMNWFVFDTMRGIATGGADAYVSANLSDAENSSADRLDVNATGFQIKSSSGSFNNSGETYIYLAIRRGPMKPPTSGTQVYNAIARTGTGAAATVTGVGFPPDACLSMNRSGTTSTGTSFYDKLRGPTKYLTGAYTNAEGTNGTGLTAFGMDGVTLGTDGNGDVNATTTYVMQFLRRYPGVFDQVCYDGSGSSSDPISVSHNYIGVVPEMAIVRRRGSVSEWDVYHKDIPTKYLKLNTTGAIANFQMFTSVSASSISMTGTGDVNGGSGAKHVMWLFATLAGISKVFATTKVAGVNKDVDCGFASGARFVLLKRTDSTGDWYLWDSVRGIVAGNDPYLLLNSTAAEVTGTDYIDPYAAGFTIVDGGLANGDYIGFAIA